MINLYLTLAAAAVSPASDGLPSPFTEQVVVRVEHGDLDLRTPEGQAELRRRLDKAGARACDEGPGPKTQSVWQQIARCRASARAEADRAIDRTTESMLASNARDLPDL